MNWNCILWGHYWEFYALEDNRPIEYIVRKNGTRRRKIRKALLGTKCVRCGKIKS